MQYQGVVVYSMADVPLVSFPNQDTARSANEDISSLPVFISDTLNWAVLLLLHLHVVFLHKIATTPQLFNVSKQNALCAVFFFFFKTISLLRVLVWQQSPRRIVGELIPCP